MLDFVEAGAGGVHGSLQCPVLSTGSIKQSLQHFNFAVLGIL
jgi:hypothetical protein